MLRDCLETSRFIHRVLIALCGAIIAVALNTPQSELPLSTAIEVLQALLGVSPEYFAKDNLLDSVEWPGFGLYEIERACRESGLDISDKVEYSVAISDWSDSSLPPNPASTSVSARDVHRYWAGFPKFRYYKLDKDVALSSIIALLCDEGVKPGGRLDKCRIEAERPVNSKMSGPTTFTIELTILDLQTGEPRVLTTEVTDWARRAEVRMPDILDACEEFSFDHTSVSRLQKGLKDLPDLNAVIPIVGHLSVANAVDELKRLVSERRPSFSIFGLSYSGMVVFVAAPLLTAGVLVNLLVHLRHLQNQLTCDPQAVIEAQSYPWIALFKGSPSTDLTIMSIFLLPVLSTGALFHQLNRLEAGATFVWFAVSIAGIFLVGSASNRTLSEYLRLYAVLHPAPPESAQRISLISQFKTWTAKVAHKARQLWSFRKQ